MTVRTCMLASAVGLALAASATAAQRGAFEARTFAEPAKPGLAVTGALSGARATSVGRVVVPTSWRRLAAPAGTLRFRSVNNQSCRYTVTYTVKSVLAPSQDASSYVTAGCRRPARATCSTAGRAAIAPSASCATPGSAGASASRRCGRAC